MCIHIYSMCMNTYTQEYQQCPKTMLWKLNFVYVTFFSVFVQIHVYQTLFVQKLNYMLHCRQVVNCKLVNFSLYFRLDYTRLDIID